VIKNIIILIQERDISTFSFEFAHAYFIQKFSFVGSYQQIYNLNNFYVINFSPIKFFLFKKITNVLAFTWFSVLLDI